MKKQKLSLKQLKVSSFVTEGDSVNAQTLKGGTGFTQPSFLVELCDTFQYDCQTDNPTVYTVCATDCRCPKDVPTGP